MRGLRLNEHAATGPIQETTATAYSDRKTLSGARLRRPARFKTIRDEGRWWSHRLMSMGVIPNGQAESHCGFSTSKKLGNAVVRNRARRRMRESVRRQWHCVQPGWDIVFAGRQPLCHADYEDIVDAVGTLLRRAHLWRESGV
jgi:ribonuclease P protein component